MLVILDVEEMVEIFLSPAHLLPALVENIKPAVAGIAGWQHAVKEKVACPEGTHHILGLANAQSMQRDAGGDEPGHVLHHVHHLAFLVNGPAPVTKPIKANLHELLGTAAAQLNGDAPLDHGKEQGSATVLAVDYAPVEFLLAPPRPLDRVFYALPLLLVGLCGVCAMIQTKQDIRAEIELLLDAFFRRQDVFLVALVATIKQTAFGDSHQVRRFSSQGEHLKATRIGDNGPVPAHEAMHSSDALDEGRSWMIRQVQGVDNQSLDATLHQIGRVEGPHDGPGRVREEGG
jgi:hypothetical protein